MQLVFSKEEVISGLTGKALDQLLTISDCPDLRVTMAGALSFVFQGWCDDDRGIMEIPECRRFFSMLTENWPFWFHFLKKGETEFGMALGLLSPVELKIMRTGVTVRFTDQQHLQTVCSRLIDGLTLLLSHMGVDREQYIQTLKSIEAEINILLP